MTNMALIECYQSKRVINQNSCGLTFVQFGNDLDSGFGAEESETVEKGQVEQVFVTFVKSFFFVPSSMPPTL